MWISIIKQQTTEKFLLSLLDVRQIMWLYGPKNGRLC